MYVLVWWLVNRARYGEVAGTSLAYRTVSDQKVNWVQCLGENRATIRQKGRLSGEPAPIGARNSPRKTLESGPYMVCLQTNISAKIPPEKRGLAHMP